MLRLEKKKLRAALTVVLTQLMGNHGEEKNKPFAERQEESVQIVERKIQFKYTGKKYSHRCTKTRCLGELCHLHPWSSSKLSFMNGSGSREKLFQNCFDDRSN